MTPPSPMSREELLELAALDAFGLLDEYEAALFTRSFHHAPAAVQDEIKELQSAFAADTAFLPGVEPGPGLRDRVLARVAKAIESESVELAPLAMIGRPRRRPRETVARIGLGASGQLWRAASFVLAGVLLVVLLFGSHQLEGNARVKDIAIDLFAQRQIEQIITTEADEDELGPDLNEFVGNRNCRPVPLNPVGAGESSLAIVFVNRKTGEAFLLTFGLPSGSPYMMTATMEGGADQLTRLFTTREAICGVYLGKVSADAIASLTWTIAEAGTGTHLLSS